MPKSEKLSTGFIQEIVLGGAVSRGPTTTELAGLSRRAIADAIQTTRLAHNVVQRLLSTARLTPRDALALADRSCALAIKTEQLIERFRACDENFAEAAERDKSNVEHNLYILGAAMLLSKSVIYRFPLSENMVVALKSLRIKLDEIVANHEQCMDEKVRRRRDLFGVVDAADGHGDAQAS